MRSQILCGFLRAALCMIPFSTDCINSSRQLERTPRPFPVLKINPEVRSTTFRFHTVPGDGCVSGQRHRWLFVLRLPTCWLQPTWFGSETWEEFGSAAFFGEWAVSKAKLPWRWPCEEALLGLPTTLGAHLGHCFSEREKLMASAVSLSCRNIVNAVSGQDMGPDLT